MTLEGAKAACSISLWVERLHLLSGGHVQVTSSAQSRVPPAAGQFSPTGDESSPARSPGRSGCCAERPRGAAGAAHRRRAHEEGLK